MNIEEYSLNPEKVAELKEIFSVYDKNGENKIPNESVRSVLQGLGYDLTEAEVLSLITEHTEQSGFTRFDEMCIILIQYASDFDRMMCVRMAFNLLDQDRKGYVVPEDVMKFMSFGGENVTKEQAEMLVRETSIFGYDRFNVVEFFIKSMNENEVIT
jgi:calmodulin